MKGDVTGNRKPIGDRRFVVTDQMLALSGPSKQAVNPFVPAEHPPSVTPRAAMAMDDSLASPMSWAGNFTASMYLGADHFIGYPELALLTQIPEYRKISEVIATEMTRKGWRFQAAGDADKSAKIEQITDAFKRFNVEEVFREAAQADGEFGRGHIYIDLGTGDDPDELKTPIGDGWDKTSQEKVGKGSLKALKTIEAVWCYPQNYNTHDPLDQDWYKPSMWRVVTKDIHASRLLTFIGREVPDLLKPAYSFGGLPLSQMMRRYIRNWHRTQESVSDLIHSFAVSGILTDLVGAISTGGADAGAKLQNRVQFFNNMRDNKGLMLLNKETEEFFNVSTPLGTLDHLQAQAQEHIASIAGIPLVKLLGVTPSGLNASSDGEIRCFYDWIHSYQELLFTSKLHTILGFIQLNEFGSVDPDITFEYEPLWSLDEKSLAEKQKTEAETDEVHIRTGVLAPSEARQRVADDPDTPYSGLDLKDEPGAPDKKIEYGARATTAIVEAFTAGVVSHAQALKELAAQSEESGIFTSITPEDIKEAEAEPPPPTEMEMMQAQAELKAKQPGAGAGSTGAGESDSNENGSE